MVEGKTDLIKGFKNSAGTKFDAFLYLDSENNIKFKFPEVEDMQTELFCPICHGKILETSYGFKCENFKSLNERAENDCSFLPDKLWDIRLGKKNLRQY